MKNRIDREKLIKEFKKNNIPTAVFYRNPFHTLHFYQKLQKPSFEVSTNLSNTIISLPMHPYLTKDDLDKIIFVIKKFYEI